MADRIIECADCKQEFVFTEGEQEFYKEKGFSDPKRCQECRKAAKERRREHDNGERGGRQNDNRQDFEVTCADCGKRTTVPFEPSQDRPVYCRECYQNRKR